MTIPSSTNGTEPLLSSEGAGVVATANKPPLPVPFDPLRLLVALKRRWFAPLAIGAMLAAATASYGLWRFRSQYTVNVQLIRRELAMSFRTTEAGEPFKPRQFTAPTVVNMMRSPSVFEAAGKKTSPRWSVSEMSRALTITPEKNTDLISVKLQTSRSAKAAADTINAYADEVVRLLKSLQAQEAAELNKFLKQQLAALDADLAEVNREMLDFSRDEQLINADKETDAYLRELGEVEMRLQTTRIDLETIDFKINGIQRELNEQSPLVTKYAEAKEQVNSLLVSYTPENPLVAEAQNKVEALDDEMRRAATNGAPFQMSANTVANALYLDVVNLKGQKAVLAQQLEKLGTFREQVQAKLQKLPAKALRYSRLKARQESIDFSRALMAGRQKEAQLFEDNALGYYRVFAAAGIHDVGSTSRGKKLITATAVGGALGLIAGMLLVFFLEILDLRVVTRADLRRLTGTPVLARLPDSAEWTDTEKEQWAFRAWNSVYSVLGKQRERSLVCGIVSAEAGEGRSTVASLLARAARQRGHKVVLATNRSSPNALSLVDVLNAPERVTQGLAAGCEARPQARHSIGNPVCESKQHATDSLGASRSDESVATIQLVAERSTGTVAIEIPAEWTWTLENREAFIEALAVWRQIESLVCLIELPPAQDTGTLLMASALPQILWLASSGETKSSDAATVIDDLRQTQCHIPGAILNREPRVFGKLPNLEKFGFAIALTVALSFSSAFGIEVPSALAVTVPPESESPCASVPTSLDEEEEDESLGTFTAAPTNDAPRLAPWQQRFTLGPGDVLNLSLYGKEHTGRAGVAINPDGTLSFLHAQNIRAAGLTVDELREKLNAELRKYVRNARVVISPVAYRSKKYFMLGTVMDRGAYYLDRPTTIIEAVARARGFSTGLYMQNTVELVDLPRAFLVRDGRRLPVNFQKLFQDGDLSQNIQLAPDDYMYFPSASINEVYVLGSVVSPGSMGVTPNATVLTMIVTRGGFTLKAYKKKVLVVRGSLEQPKATVVDCEAILAGRAKDFLVEPKDIIYVSDRPWTYVEELLDLALSAFVQASVATWTGGNIGPLIVHPLLPSIE